MSLVLKNLINISINKYCLKQKLMRLLMQIISIEFNFKGKSTIDFFKSNLSMSRHRLLCKLFSWLQSNLLRLKPEGYDSLSSAPGT